MPEVKKSKPIGSLLKELLEKRSLSMRKLSELSKIDTATISRIVNGKRKARPEHLQKFATCLDVPIADLFAAAGYPMETEQKKIYSDELYLSVDSIQKVLKSSQLYDQNFTIERVEEQLEKYQQFAQTEEGKETILKSFDEKLQKLGSIGPFISHLKEMFDTFCSMKVSSHHLSIIGGVLLYFILPVDVIPDYIFPIGYLDDAVAVQLVSDLLTKK